MIRINFIFFIFSRWKQFIDLQPLIDWWLTDHPSWLWGVAGMNTLETSKYCGELQQQCPPHMFSLMVGGLGKWREGRMWWIRHTIRKSNHVTCRFPAFGDMSWCLPVSFFVRFQAILCQTRVITSEVSRMTVFQNNYFYDFDTFQIWFVVLNCFWRGFAVMMLIRF